jgi:hypothetical protein
MRLLLSLLELLFLVSCQRRRWKIWMRRQRRGARDGDCSSVSQKKAKRQDLCAIVLGTETYARAVVDWHRMQWRGSSIQEN